MCFLSHSNPVRGSLTRHDVLLLQANDVSQLKTYSQAFSVNNTGRPIGSRLHRKLMRDVIFLVGSVGHFSVDLNTIYKFSVALSKIGSVTVDP